ncbi:MAG: hypothetical protein HYW34_00580 [Candidatus Brennerbacteria bacterium]|nr:hypothetical protein [Candidatus Brennerbacteria bacterium]
MNFLLFSLLSFIGALDTLYLIIKHRQPKPFVCPFDHDCSKVTESKWGNFFYFRNENIGFVYYSVMAILGFYAFFNASLLLTQIFFFGAVLAFLAHIFFVSVQIFALKDYCFYCLISAIISLLMFITVLI